MAAIRSTHNSDRVALWPATFVRDHVRSNRAIGRGHDRPLRHSSPATAAENPLELVYCTLRLRRHATGNTCISAHGVAAVLE